MNIGRRTWLAAISSVAGSGLVRGQSPASGTGRGRYQTALSKVDEVLNASQSKLGVGSLVAGVVSGPDLIWSKAYGVASIEDQTTATTENVYRIGSVTKQFTSIAFLQLVRDGKVKLTDPVEKYVPEITKTKGWPKGAPPVTLVQLATHTSGLDREPADVPRFTTGPVSEWDKTLVAALEDTSFVFEPGTRQVYSNIAVGTLGLALGRAAGVPYIDYVKRNILEPLGLRNTSFQPDATLLSRVTPGYVLKGGKPDPSVTARELKTGRGYKVPNGALFTTVADLGRFVSFELGCGPEGVLPKETLATNHSRIYFSNGLLASGYGIGFGAFRRGDLVIAGHGGSVAGFVAGAYFHRKSQVGFVYLRNVGQSLHENELFDTMRPLVEG